MNSSRWPERNQCVVAFERWAEDQLYGTDRDDGGRYLSADTDTAWAGWLAAWERLQPENERLKDSVRRLADEDATLSVCNGNVTVTMDSQLTDEQRIAIQYVCSSVLPDGSREGDDALHTLRTMVK
jgi:hypothetical protein